MASTDLVRLLGEKYTATILQATYQPQTAQELSDEHGIPIATTYRRLNALTEADVLREISVDESNDGTTLTTYQRTVDDIKIVFEDDSIEITFQQRHEVYPGLRDIWLGLIS